jgi:glycerate kinase
MRVLVAPDKFAGTLTAAEAGAAIESGWLRRRPDDVVVVVPVADGGVGTVAALAAYGTTHTTDVEDPLGRRVHADWLLLGDGTAVVESAAACGLHLCDDGRDPLRASTSGVGELLCAVADEDVRRIVVGVGGTASTDGGAGLAQALGAWLLAASGHPVDNGGGGLGALDRIDLTDLDPRLADLDVVVAADVDATLLGPQGAAYGFAAQKGATPAQVAALDEALRTYAAVVARDVPGASDIADRPYGGAGGGLAAGLMAFCGGVAQPGAGVVLDLLGFDKHAGRADVVVTGEGCFDWQSLRGKAPAAVAARAARDGVPCLLLAGQVEAGRRESAAAGIDATYAVADLAGSVEESLAEPGGWLEELAYRVAGEWSR